MSSELDLRGLHRMHDPDPAFVGRLRAQLQTTPTDATEAATDRVDAAEIPPDLRLDAARPSRRRIAFLAAAVVVVLAGVGTIVWSQLDDSDRTIFAGGADAAFVGSWVSTDTDGSIQSLEIEAIGGNAYAVVARDGATPVCSGAPSTMSGTGQAQPDGSLVIVKPEFGCDDGSTPTVDGGRPIEELLANLAFVHEPETDELRDSRDFTWRRRPADAVIPPMRSGAMWPQSSVNEVREAQERADAGDPAYTWQVDPQLGSAEWSEHLWTGRPGIAERFLRDELGWDQALFSMFEGAGDHNVVYLRCAPGETNPMYPDAPAQDEVAVRAEQCAPTIDDLHYETVSFNLSQPDREGPDGIWVVSGWATGGSFAQTDPNLAEAQATARLEDLLQARLEGDGAEEYVEVAGSADEVPLLYATTDGARYERFEIDRVTGPRWPYGEMEFTVRLIANGGGTVVEQPIAWSGSGGAQPTLVVLDPTETTENGRPVAVTYDYGELTISAAAPWDAITFPITALTLGDQDVERIELVADPRPVGTGCDTGPAPADANGLAATIRDDPDIEATAPEAVTIGGTEALVVDVSVAPVASVCSRSQSALVLARDDVTMSGLRLADGNRMRLYLVDVPAGLTTRLFAIAIVAPEARFEDVMAAAAPLVESIEFRTEGP